MRVEAEAAQPAAREPRGRGQPIPLLGHREGPPTDFSFATPFTFSPEIRLTSRFYQGSAVIRLDNAALPPFKPSSTLFYVLVYRERIYIYTNKGYIEILLINQVIRVLDEYLILVGIFGDN